MDAPPAAAKVARTLSEDMGRKSTVGEQQQKENAPPELEQSLQLAASVASVQPFQSMLDRCEALVNESEQH